MRKIFVLLFCVFITVSSSYSSSQFEGLLMLKEKIGKDTVSMEIYQYKEEVNVGDTIFLLHDTIKSLYSGSLFFVDKQPCANWDHSCEYVWYLNGDLYSLEATQPPLCMDTWINIHQCKDGFEGVKESGLRSMGMTSLQSGRNIDFSQNKFALIISGGANKDYNYVRYWNDCSLIYSALVNVYGYLSDNIYVAISDGTNPALDRKLLDGSFDSSPLDLNADGIDDVKYDATFVSLQNIFNELSNVMTDDDELFIFVTDHGYRKDNHSYINLWESSIRDDAFASLVKTLQVKSISVVMEQCYSGGFIEYLDDDGMNISTACSGLETSYAMSNLLYNEYSYYWTVAMLGRNVLEGSLVNADVDNDGVISMYEAYVYAKNNDSRNEHPQYLSNPNTLGLSTSLNTKIDVSISGPSSICREETYTIDGLPDDAEVQWIATVPFSGPGKPVFATPLVVQEGQGTSTVTFKQGNYLPTMMENAKPYVGEAEIRAKITYGSASVTLTKDVYVQTTERPEITLSLYPKPDIDVDSSFITHPGIGGGSIANPPLSNMASYEFSCANLEGHEDFQWTFVASNGTQVKDGRSVIVNHPAKGTLVVTLRHKDGCPDAAIATETYTVMGLRLLATNPASGSAEMQVVWDATPEGGTGAMSLSAVPTIPYEGEYEIELWDLLRGRLMVIEGEGGYTQFPLCGIPSGNYVLRLVIDGQQMDSLPLTVR